MAVERRESQLFGVLVTYRRPGMLAESLEAAAAQTRPLDHLVVVDNAPTPETRAVVERLAPGAEYLAASHNLGPAGGLALGMERVLAIADDGDWLLTLDDDDPATDPTIFAVLLELAGEMSARDRSVAGVGTEGIRFDRRRGRVVWVADDELHGPVSVDSVGGRNFPMYSVAALRAVGTMRRDLFFGFEELELGLRLRDAGYCLFAPGDFWHARRKMQGLLGTTLVPSRTLRTLTWRRYYSLRNLIRVLIDCGSLGGALRVTLVVGIGKPLVNLLFEPRRAAHHLWLNIRACRDAWTGRMGRTVDPP